MKVSVGKSMYCVFEYFFYSYGSACPQREYCVCNVTVDKIYGRDRNWFSAIGKRPDKGTMVHHFRVSDIGKKVFFRKEDAENKAFSLNVW